MVDHAANLRRLMARDGLTLHDVVQRTGLNQRTIKGMLSGDHKPHARTLHRLAEGLGVDADEFFQDPALLAYSAFDCETNPLVEEVIASHRPLVAGWTQLDFAELYSRFGAGGALTQLGALDAIHAMNHKRNIHQKVALLLESSESELLTGFVELLYQRIVLPSPPTLLE